LCKYRKLFIFHITFGGYIKSLLAVLSLMQI
jgi:hypothetical protein